MPLSLESQPPPLVTCKTKIIRLIQIFALLFAYAVFAFFLLPWCFFCTDYFNPDWKPQVPKWLAFMGQLWGKIGEAGFSLEALRLLIMELGLLLMGLYPLLFGYSIVRTIMAIRAGKGAWALFRPLLWLMVPVLGFVGVALFLLIIVYCVMLPPEAFPQYPG